MATVAAGYAAAAVAGRTPQHLLESVDYRACSVAGSPRREPVAPEGNGPLVLAPGWAEERKGVRPAASMPEGRRGGGRGCDACPEPPGIGGRRRESPLPLSCGAGELERRTGVALGRVSGPGGRKG